MNTSLPGATPAPNPPNQAEELTPLQKVRCHIGSASDAMNRALDRLAGEDADFFDCSYANRQIGFAIGRLVTAQVEVDNLADAVVNVVDADEPEVIEPITADDPNVPAQDVTEGGGA